MAKLKELISQYNQRLTEASSVPDHRAVLDLVAEYRKSVKDLEDCHEDIREELGLIISRPDRTRIDLLLIAASIHPSQAYVDSLCAILAVGEPTLPNEQIVDLLYKIPSPKSVPYLKKACLLTLPHDAYDEFGVKCLEALAAINTPDAWAVIEAASGSSSLRIRERAQELNQWRGS